MKLRLSAVYFILSCNVKTKPGPQYTLLWIKDSRISMVIHFPVLNGITSGRGVYYMAIVLM